MHTIKSGIMKIFNMTGLDDMVAMNRLVANDLEMRKNNKDAKNIFHSQGTIIGTGAFDILKNKIETLRKDAKIEYVDADYNPENIQKKIREAAKENPELQQAFGQPVATENK